MNTTLKIICLSLLAFQLSAQSMADMNKMLEVYDEKTDGLEIGIFADNQSFSPITMVLEFSERKGIKLEVDLPLTVVVPARSEKVLLMKVFLLPNKSASFQYGYNFILGDSQNANHNDDHLYELPFEKGKEYLVGQGYRGKMSHQGINAIDFNMDVGTKICAARGGIVIFTKENSKKGCRHSSCKDDANFVLILHDDGSIGHYAHLKYKGACVKPGDKVKAGKVIGYSGNTGWSSGPHLHFEVWLPSGKGFRSLPTKFKTSESAEGIWLEEGQVYRRS